MDPTEEALELLDFKELELVGLKNGTPAFPFKLLVDAIEFLLFDVPSSCTFLLRSLSAVDGDRSNLFDLVNESEGFWMDNRLLIAPFSLSSFLTSFPSFPSVPYSPSSLPSLSFFLPFNLLRRLAPHSTNS